VFPSASLIFVGSGTGAEDIVLAVARIETGTVMVDGVSTFFRRVPGESAPAVFVHGNPTHSGDWQPFLERMEGPALALDLPGWGRSDRPPPGEFDYSMDGLARFVRRFLQRMAVEEHSLVVHDWGSLALIGAQEEPERIRRLLVANAVPLLPGYRWHRTARIWRTRGLGEASRVLATPRLVDIGLRESRGDWSRHDPAFVEEVVEQMRDRRRLAAILGLYRSGDPERLAAAGDRLGSIGAPALVIWGLRDRYIPSRFGGAYADVLPSADLLELPEAGHWPWIDEPAVIERVIGFLAADEDSGPV
jgi:pimeloyl-ACP methyl ester carboxylesterase